MRALPDGGMSHNHHHGDNSMTGGHDHDHDTMSGNSGDNCTDHMGHGDHAGHTMKVQCIDLDIPLGHLPLAYS